MTAVMSTRKEDTKLRLEMQGSPTDSDTENHIYFSECLSCMLASMH